MSWYITGRVFDTNNDDIGVPAISVVASGGASTYTDHDGRYQLTISDALGGQTVSIFLLGFRSGDTVGSTSTGGVGSVKVLDFPVGNDTRRQRHDRGDEFHSGVDYDYGVVAEYLPEIGFDNNLHDILAALVQATRDRTSPYLRADADFLKTIQNIPAFNWNLVVNIGGGFDTPFTAAVFANSTWVAVGWLGTLYTTTDAISGTWTSHSPGVTNDYTCIGFDGTTFVIAGSGGLLQTSTTPTSEGSWVTSTSAGTAFGSFEITAIAFGNGVWVAGAIGGRMATATSPTGTWTARTSYRTNVNSGGFITDIKYAAGVWVACDSSGFIATATDPTSTWTTRSSASADYLQIGYFNGLWGVGGYRSATGPTRNVAVVSTASTPTSTWTSHDVIDTGTTSGAFILGMTAGDDGWWVGTAFVQGAAPRGRTVRTQDPAGTWTITNDTIVAGGGRRVINNDRTWLIVGNNNDTGDGVIESALSYSPTSLFADARIVATVSASFTANADLKRNQTASLAANADLFKTVSSSFTANGALFRTTAGSFTADAELLRGGLIRADAVLYANITGSFTADALLINAFEGDAFQSDTFQ